MINPQRFLATLLLLPLLLTTPARSQPTSRPGPGQGGGAILERVQAAVKELGLSDEQKTKVQAIIKKAQDEWTTMRADVESMEPQERMQRIRGLIDDARKEISDVLTPEQKATLDKKFEAARQSFRNRPGQGGPTSRPAGGPGGPGGPGFADRLRENLQKLDLSDEQKAKIKDLFEEMKTKGEGLRMQAESGVEEARVKMREMFQQTREKLNAILTPEQRDKLRDLMGGPGGPGGAPRRGEPGRPRPGQPDQGKPGNEKADADKGMMMQDGDNMISAGSSKSPDKKKNDTVALAPTNPAPPGPTPGEPAPQLTFRKLDGGQLPLSSLKGHVIVLEFGSYSCPAFRNRVAALEKLKAEYGTRVSFYVVYAKEAHALGEWDVDRNKDDGISVEQPKSIEARKTLAEQTRDKLKITAPILLDSIGNDAMIALGAGANSAYVISRDGTILARQKWFEPIALRHVLDEASKTSEAAKGGATTKPAA